MIEETKDNNNESVLKEFSIETKRSIIDIINDAPSLVKLGDNDYIVKDMRFYSVYRICKLALKMKECDENISDDNAIITALCTDLDSMCEIMAIILCNHLFNADNEKTYEDLMTRNDKLIREMKSKVMNSTFEINQWASIILGALKSIDLTGFFLLKKSVSSLTDSLLTRKRKSEETASQFMEALSLQTHQTL